MLGLRVYLVQHHPHLVVTGHSGEAALCNVLRRGERPSAALVEAVAAAKVKAVDEAIDFCHRLRQEVGSYALMAGTVGRRGATTHTCFDPRAMVRDSA